MRTRFIKAELSGQAFAVQPKILANVISALNEGAPRMQETVSVANNSVVYQEVSNVAVISVDGGMYKKSMDAMCMSVASYDQMIKAIDKAEANNNIDTILFRVDTPGGSVAGADEVENRIAQSSKKTYTLYENMGASGGIWIFTASDQLFATEATMLGSIGVLITYLQEDDKNQVTLVSKNAENKNCALNGNCEEKLQGMIDTYEEMFYARVEKNTGFNAEKIKTVFNNGDMIFAKEALSAGFIQGVTTFQTLLLSLIKGGSLSSTAMPTASSDKLANSNQGDTMEFNQENFDILVESRQHLNSNIQALNAQLEEKNSALDAMKGQLESAKAQAQTDLANQLSEAGVRIAEAFATGVATEETIVAMLQAESNEKASEIAIAAKQTVGANGGKPDAEAQEEEDNSGANLRAYAEKHKGRIK